MCELQNFSTVISDLEAVSVKVVGESTIDVHHQFINGSDAYGYRIVLVSGHPTDDIIVPRVCNHNTHSSNMDKQLYSAINFAYTNTYTTPSSYIVRKYLTLI